MKKTFLLMKMLFFLALLCVGQGAWAQTTVTYDFTSFSARTLSNSGTKAFSANGVNHNYASNLPEVYNRFAFQFAGTFSIETDGLYAQRDRGDHAGICGLASGDKVTINFSQGAIMVRGDITNWTGNTSAWTSYTTGTEIPINAAGDLSFQAKTLCKISSIVITTNATESMTAPSIASEANGSARTVTITDGASNLMAPVTTYYTTDGTDPTTSSTKYTEPFDVDATCTIKAITISSSSAATASTVTSQEIDMDAVDVPTAAITAVDGVNRTVTFSCTTEGATLYYSTDNGENYTEGTSLVISADTNIKVKATKGSSSAESESLAFEAGTEIVLNAPTWTKTGYSEGVSTVTLADDQSGKLLSPVSTIMYQINDGAEQAYSSAISVNDGETLKYWSVATGYTNSAVGSVVAIAPNANEAIVSENYVGVVSENNNLSLADGEGYRKIYYNGGADLVSENLLASNINSGNYYQMYRANGLYTSFGWNLAIPNLKAGDYVTLNGVYGNGAFSISGASNMTADLWNSTAGSKYCYTVNADGDVTFSMGRYGYLTSITVQRAPVTYAVTVADGIVGGTVAADPTSANAGAEVTLTNTPAEGYEFVSYSVTCKTNNEAVTVTDGKFTMPADDVTVSATFAKVYTVTISNEIENGTVVADPTSAKAGDEVTLTNTPAEGYEFVSYSVTGKTNNEAVDVSVDGKFIMPADDVTVSATFQLPAPATYAVTIAEGIEGGTVAADPTSAKAGDEVTLTNTPAEGYEFVSYSVKGVHEDLAVIVTDGKFTMPADDVTVSAEFKAVDPSGDEEVALAADMFYTWDGYGADASKIASATVDFKLGESVAAGTTVVGTGSVEYLTYADMTGSTKVIFEGKDGTAIRLLMNRQESNNGPLVEKTATIAEGKAEISLTDLAYVHINAIKIPYNGSTDNLISAITFVKPNDPLAGPKEALKDAIAAAKMQNSVAKTEESFAALTKAITDGEAALADAQATAESLTAAKADIETAVKGLTLAEGYAEVTKEMFKQYASVDEPGEGTATNGAYELFTASDLPYGDGSVSELKWADLTKYDKLIVTVAGTTAPRFCMNRLVKDGQQAATQEDSKMLDINPNNDNTWSTEKYQTVADGVYTIDLATIVSDYGFARLHCIKKQGWGAGVVVTGMYLHEAPVTYDITVADGIENGTVTVDPTTAKAGDEVTITATPAEGYELASISVTGQTSNLAVEVTDGKFTMPEDAVTVSATFKKKPIYIETDLTSQFSALTDYTKWTGATGYAPTEFCPAVAINDGTTKQVCEKYETTCATTGDVFYQTVTGLAAGTYKIELYGGAAYTFGRGFSSEAFSEGTWNAGDKIEPSAEVSTGVVLSATTSEGTYGGEIPIYYATNFPDGAATVTLDGVQVGADGQLKIGMNKTSQSTNWHVVQLKGVMAQVDARELHANAVAAANAALSAEENAVIVGEEKTALEAAIEKNSEVAEETADAYKAAIEALQTATSTFTSAREAYAALASTIKAVEGYVANYVYASAEKTAAVTAAAEAAPTSAADATSKNANLINALRAMAESHAKAEGVEGAEAIAITNPSAEDSTNGWTTVLGEGSEGSIGVLSNEPWTSADGSTAHKYFDGGNWGASAWDVSLTQNVELAAGKYMLSAISRASGDVALTLFAGESKTTMPSIGAAGGIFDRGWNISSVEFEVNANSTVTIGVQGVTSVIHNWMSFSDFKLVLIESYAVKVAKAELLEAINEAKAIDTEGKNGAKELADAITVAEGVYNNDEATVDDVNTAKSDLTAAVAAFDEANKVYAVNVDAEIENGTVAVNPTSAKAGDEVTITATPAEGYELASITVTGVASEEIVEVTDGKFTMPADDVTVTATFVLATGIDAAPADKSIKADGKYFKNGKLIIIKNGKEYNAAGVAK